MKKKLVEISASFFYLGNAPFVPGTLGSLAGLWIAWFLNGSLTAVFFALTFVGFLVCRPAVRVYGTSDPRPFVLDEVCGMMFSVLWAPLNAVTFLMGFVLFRLLDSVKPWPISWIQRSSSAYAIMWDDLAAGLLTNLILQALNLYAPRILSFSA